MITYGKPITKEIYTHLWVRRWRDRTLQWSSSHDIESDILKKTEDIKLIFSDINAHTLSLNI